ncbi:putative addiction module antidote protein [Bradyrhizobium sp. Gha]|uniref:putative addiction module antidote protein n=1 Tax=Bradyrhizobium sp. Gha TaxID=1855318 RepID=UPI0008F15711|nr:DNA-binding prophage protein [Bradyrhizobium sp. Gha]
MKTYRPVVPSKLAAELKKAFASAEPHTICKAMERHLAIFNIAEMARETGLQGLYRAFQTHTKLPNFTTILAVLMAMGLHLQVAPHCKPSKAGSIRPKT